MPRLQILPSILAADMGRLAEECRRAEAAGADALHVDVMDGHFVPNLSMGPSIVAAVKQAVKIPLDVHLMISNPEKYVEAFMDAGANSLLIHIEIEADPIPILRSIRERGVTPGITLNPDTPAEAIRPVLNEVDEVLCMTVHPGFGGQAFMEAVLPKVREIRSWDPGLELSVDGGLDLRTAEQAARAGANMIVAGTSLFRANPMAPELRAMRERAEAAYAENAASQP